MPKIKVGNQTKADEDGQTSEEKEKGKEKG
jgi:hypothetical protein